MERRGFQFGLRAALLVLSFLGVPLALIRGGATLSAVCFLYAIVVVPIAAEMSQRRLRELDAKQRVKP